MLTRAARNEETPPSTGCLTLYATPRASWFDQEHITLTDRERKTQLEIPGDWTHEPVT